MTNQSNAELAKALRRRADEHWDDATNFTAELLRKAAEALERTLVPLPEKMPDDLFAGRDWSDQIPISIAEAKKIYVAVYERFGTSPTLGALPAILSDEQRGSLTHEIDGLINDLAKHDITSRGFAGAVHRWYVAMFGTPPAPSADERVVYDQALTGAADLMVTWLDHGRTIADGTYRHQCAICGGTWDNDETEMHKGPCAVFIYNVAKRAAQATPQRVERIERSGEDRRRPMVINGCEIRKDWTVVMNDRTGKDRRAQPGAEEDTTIHAYREAGGHVYFHATHSDLDGVEYLGRLIVSRAE